jgi:hypothetical protein
LLRRKALEIYQAQRLSPAEVSRRIRLLGLEGVCDDRVDPICPFEGSGGGAKLLETVVIAATVVAAPGAGAGGGGGLPYALRGPRAFGLKSIAEDPVLIQLWEEALRNTVANARGGNAYTALLESPSVATADELSKAFQAVSKNFRQLAREAGYEMGGPIHHWNFSKAAYPNQVFDPRNLFPTRSFEQHKAIHQLMSSSDDIWYGPIVPDEAIEIEYVGHPLASAAGPGTK